MARTKRTQRKSTGGKQPRKQLATKASRGNNKEEDIELQTELVLKHQRLKTHVICALIKSTTGTSKFKLPNELRFMDLIDSHVFGTKADDELGDEKLDDMKDEKEDDNIPRNIDVKPFEFLSVRTIDSTMSRKLHISNVVLNNIALRITENSNRWEPVTPNSKSTSKVRALECNDRSLTFTPTGRPAFRPSIKIIGISQPVTIECFVFSQYDQLGNVLDQALPAVVVNVPPLSPNSPAYQKILPIERIRNGASGKNLYLVSSVLTKKYAYDYPDNGLRNLCFICGHEPFVFCYDHGNPYCKYCYEHRDGRVAGTAQQYYLVPTFTDCQGLCSRTAIHPSVGIYQTAVVWNIFNLFDRNEKNNWINYCEHIVCDIICGGGIIWDSDFTLLQEPKAILSKFHQIFQETTQLQCSTNAKFIVDTFGFHTYYHTVQYPQRAKSKYSLGIDSLLQEISERVTMISQELVKTKDNREYICIMVGCDLDDHTLQFRTVANLKAHVLYFVNSPRFTFVSSWVEIFRRCIMDEGKFVLEAFFCACSLMSTTANLMMCQDNETIVSYNSFPTKIVREIWRVSCSPHQLISRHVAVTFQPTVFELPSVNDIMKGSTTCTPTPSSSPSPLQLPQEQVVVVPSTPVKQTTCLPSMEP